MQHRRIFLCICAAFATLAGSTRDVAGQEQSRRMRVLSYNMHHGRGSDGKIDLKRIANVIRSTSADLVALQEVDRNTRRSGGVDQPAELARLTEMEAVFERNIEYQGGDYGNAVLSRLPIERHQNHALPSYYDGEQRGVLEVEVQLRERGPPLIFFATHLDHRRDDRERMASAKTIEELAGRHKNAALIVAGDLNATPDSRVIESFQRIWRSATSEADPTPTFPAEMPKRQIDYVLYRPPDRWRVVEVRVIDEPVASDHRPILAVLEWRP